MQQDKPSPNKNIRKRLTLFVGLALSLHTASLLAIEPLRAISADTKNSNKNSSLSARHTAAIEAARAGKLDAALAELSTLHQLAPSDSKIFADYIVVLTWAKKNTEALQIAETSSPKDIPEYALAAVAKAARTTGATTKSLSLYEALMQRYPEKLDYKIAHALVLIDAKQYKQAELEIDMLKENNIENVELLNADLYLGKQSNQQIKVLDASQRLLALNPNDLDLANSMVTAASQLGATSKAAELTQKYQLNASKTREIRTDYAASQVRWGTLDPVDPSLPYLESDKALQTLDQTCQCDWTKVNVADAEMRRLVFDRMVALRDRHRPADVIMHYNQLTAGQIAVPNYALNAAGDAYLALREPEKALAAYNTILSKDPANHNVRMDKVYALIELERFAEASKLINDIAISQPAYLNRTKNPVVRQNDYKLEADSLAYYNLAYADDLAASEKRFTQLRNIGPNNLEVKNNLATIWRWRGWYDRAEEGFHKSLSTDKDSTQAKYGLANTLIDLREWRLAEQQINALNSYLDANDPTLKALNRRWELHNKRQFIMDLNSSKSSGSAVGSRSQDINAWLYSAPFNDHYRAYISTAYARDTFVEGVGKVIAPNIGLEYRSRNWRLTTQLGLVTADGHGASTAATAEYRPNDYWQANAGLDINSQQMPLRGQRVGVRGNNFSLGGGYRWSELMQLSANANVMDMSDGNLRQLINSSFSRRIYTTPHYKANLILGLSGSKNSLNNAAYFNPKSDTSLNATLDQDWVTWRRYDRSFSQRLQLSTGNYAQQNFGSDNTWSIGYSHEWQLDNVLELSYGINRTAQPYDGVKEYRNDLFARINLLF